MCKQKRKRKHANAMKIFRKANNSANGRDSYRTIYTSNTRSSFV